MNERSLIHLSITKELWQVLETATITYQNTGEIFPVIQWLEKLSHAVKNCYSNDDVASALIDVVDGVTWRDIKEFSGLTDERCKQICAIARHCETR